MKKYIGITIGPVFETMDFVTSPSALWASSYIFSYISQSICRRISAEYRNVKIISPYYDESCSIKNGVGLFPDRIIFEKPDEFSFEFLKEMKAEIIGELKGEFAIKNPSDYLDDYFMIAGAEFEAENPILGSTQIFDCLELSKSFVSKESNNPILDVFTSADTEKGNDEDKRNAKSRNNEIKTIVKEKLKIEDWQLFADGKNTIKDLGTIARSDDSDKKYNDYCAIVRADGDRMTQIINAAGDNKINGGKLGINEFSKACFSYCQAAAELVKSYGGVTIYSGGDDLLAIMPCKSQRGTLLDFSKELSEKFNEIFENYIDICKKEKPSLSVAIQIFYKKYPLYEAVEASVPLLFDKAKALRNCTAISLQKHSGRSLELIIPNESIGEVQAFQNIILKKHDENKNEKEINEEDKKRNDVLVSALYKISEFEELFNMAETDDQVNNLFTNVFDASFHEDNDFLHTTLPKFYNKFRTVNTPIYFYNQCKKIADAHENHDRTPEKPAQIFSALMRLFKFYLEKEGEK